jgi:hypothetical protein
MRVTQISHAQEVRTQSEIARLEAVTNREQTNPRHDPERWGAALLRESIRVLLLSGLSKSSVVAVLHTVANDLSHGRPLRSSP